VSVEAAIEFSGTAVGTIQRVSMTKPNSTLFGVANGRNPLQVLVPRFLVKSIRQSTPVIKLNNTFSVILTANYDLDQNSVITVSNLIGSATVDDNTLSIESLSVLRSTAEWSQASGTLKLTVASAVPSNNFSFSFILRNPDADTTSPDVRVEASIMSSGASVGYIAVSSMQKPGTRILGVENGADPMTVLGFRISTRTIEQNTPFAAVQNRIKVSISLNYDIPQGSTLTITGMNGTQTDDQTLPVTTTGDLLGSSSNWTKNTGTLVLRVMNT